ncbi:MAG: GtrA family protein [Alistipes sp.]
MALARLITKLIDVFYIPLVAHLMPLQLFRYAVCGALTMALDITWYTLFYNFVFDRVNLDLGLLVISPHIAAMLLVFPITFMNGFWLNSHVAFHSSSPLTTRAQLVRYALSVVGSILLTYGCIKFFVEVCHFWPFFSKIFTNVITVIYSFLAAKYFTFRPAVKG